jgi:hypothetical protein
MARVFLYIAGLLFLAAASATQASERKSVYKWTDEQGNVHYSDQIPPRFADRPGDVLNEQGVDVGDIEGRKTEAQRAEEARLAAEQRAADEAARRDRVLLETYLSVEEIELLRDRRLELLRSQIQITQLYLRNLRAKLLELEREAGGYQPFSTDPEAEPMPPELAAEMSDVRDAIDEHLKTLSVGRERQEELRAQFAADIARFRELKTD